MIPKYGFKHDFNIFSKILFTIKLTCCSYFESINREEEYFSSIFLSLLYSHKLIHIFPSTERSAPPVTYTNPPPLSPPDDIKHLVTDEEELYGRKYNYNYNERYQENLDWREPNDNQNLIEQKQLNTFGPFFQNQGVDGHGQGTYLYGPRQTPVYLKRYVM